MARQFGSLAYFERLDAYLPSREVAEDPERAGVASRAKAAMLQRLVALERPANRLRLLRLLGFDAARAEALPDREVPEVSLLVKEGGAWTTVHPRAARYRLAEGEVEFYRAGPNPHDGMRVNVFDAQGGMRHWCLVRASGTEAVLRVYMEVLESLEEPDPMRLVDAFAPLLCYLGLDAYALEDRWPDYVTEFRRTVAAKYG
jgi:hypothetical protein